MSFTVASVHSSFDARAEGQPRTEPRPTVVASNAPDPDESSASGSSGEARVCSVCGDRDPRWHGLDSSGWGEIDGKPACPGCMWMAA